MKQKSLIEEVKAPVRKFKAGAVFVAVWSNKGQNEGEYKTISLERRYKCLLTNKSITAEIIITINPNVNP